MLTVIVKRLHDREKSGWWLLVYVCSFYFGFTTHSNWWFFVSAFLPYLGWFWGFLGIGFLPGTYQSDSFGSSTSISFPPGFNHMLGMLAKLAVSDTFIITTDEYKVVHTILTDALKLSGSAYNEAMRIFNASLNSDIPYEVYVRRFYTVNGHDREVLQAVFDLLILLAAFDGELTPQEDLLIKQTVSIFNIDYRYDHDEYEEEDEDEYEEEEEDQTNYQSPDEHYASILGLEGNITPDTVRQAYRNMVKQYHPDKVAHLGPKLRQAAEEEMKLINEACDYFKKKFSM
jgi:DnaJ like chaperone protein